MNTIFHQHNKYVLLASIMTLLLLPTTVLSTPPSYEHTEHITDETLATPIQKTTSTTTFDTGLMDSPWPMKCHDLHHTSQSPYVADDGDGLEKWRYKTDWSMESSAVIDNKGIIYFGDHDYTLRALYPNATLKWQYHTNGRIWSTPAIAADGTIYVASWDCKLHAVNPNGTRKWVVSTGGSISSSPAIGPDGMIYIGNMRDNGEIIAIYPNGTINWRYPTGYFVVSDPAIGDDGTIYCGSGDTYFYALNPNGTLKWRYKTGDWVKAHPTIAEDGTIYISSFDGWLYALNPTNGSLLWKYTDGGDEANPALGPDGIIYLGNSRLRALYPNGTLKWSTNLGTNIGHSSPALSSDGRLYVGAGKTLFCINSTDGTELWRKHLANTWVASSPIIGPDGTVYIGSSSDKMINEGYYISLGYLHAFGPVSTNNPPPTPTLTGKPKGAAGNPQIYGLRTDDPDNNPISFYIDWGDGNYTNWSGGGKSTQKEMPECASGETVYFEHIFTEQGTYTIRAKARDTLGEESDWATLQVQMPIANSYSFLNKLVNRFPLLAKLLELFTKDTTPPTNPQDTIYPPTVSESDQQDYLFKQMTYDEYSANIQ